MTLACDGVKPSRMLFERVTSAGNVGSLPEGGIRTRWGLQVAFMMHRLAVGMKCYLARKAYRSERVSQLERMRVSDAQA